MKPLLHFYLLLLSLPVLCYCQAPPPVIPRPAAPVQDLVGGGCDGCELMFVGMPASIFPVDTSSGFGGSGQPLLISGTVYNRDGRTPAEGVVLYYWHTDHTGRYSAQGGGDEGVKRHGDLRGWVKTGNDGTYAIYTIRPAPYPDTNNPAHVHLSVKEPAIANEYYIDDILFEDDPLVTATMRATLEQRGGNGILQVSRDQQRQVVRRNITLGLNIPAYPQEKVQ